MVKSTEVTPGEALASSNSFPDWVTPPSRYWSGPVGTSIEVDGGALSTLTLTGVLVSVFPSASVAILLGTIVAMQSSAAVKDRHQHDRVITTLLLFLPAVGAVTLAALLSPFGKIADVGFIAVLFSAVWVRRFGPRGNALGMVAFISYFFALFLHATLAQIPTLAVAIAVGIAASLFVRTLIFPDRPRVEVRRLVRALRGVSSSVLEAATNRAEYELQRSCVHEVG